MNSYPVLKYNHPLGVTITVYPLNETWDTLNINNFYASIFQADKFWKRYIPDIFKGMIINIYNALRPDIPRNKYNEHGNIIFYGIGDSDGLSFGGEKRIELNSRAIGTTSEMILTFYHELSHQIDFIQDLKDDPTDIIEPEYRKIEYAVNSGSLSSPFERKAEHGLELLMGQGFKRGDFKSIWEIQGLKDLYLIQFKVAQFVKALRTANVKITNIVPRYEKDNFNYFGIYFRATYPDKTYYDYFADKDGWQQKIFDRNGKFLRWDSICRF